jgi:hypothetical protein
MVSFGFKAQGAIEYLLIIAAAIVVVAVVLVAIISLLNTGTKQVTDADASSTQDSLRSMVQGLPPGYLSTVETVTAANNLAVTTKAPLRNKTGDIITTLPELQALITVKVNGATINSSNITLLASAGNIETAAGKVGIHPATGKISGPGLGMNPVEISYIAASNASAAPQIKINGYSYAYTDPLLTNLVALWHFDSRTGAITPDEFLLHNATLSPGATISATNCKSAGCVSFTGADDSNLTIPSMSIPTTSSISFWIRLPSTPSGVVYQTLFTNGLGSTGIYYKGTSTKKINFYYTTGDHFSTAALSNATWYYYVIVNNLGAVTFYRNGAADGTAASAISFPFSKMGADNSSENFTGLIDEVAIWNKALTAAQVSALYNNRSSGFDN